jgi:hypothetical protein
MQERQADSEVIVHEAGEPDVLADWATPTFWPANTVLKLTFRFS